MGNPSSQAERTEALLRSDSVGFMRVMSVMRVMRVICLDFEFGLAARAVCMLICVCGVWDWCVHVDSLRKT